MNNYDICRVKDDVIIITIERGVFFFYQATDGFFLDFIVDSEGILDEKTKTNYFFFTRISIPEKFWTSIKDFHCLHDMK